jgi:hypothetical protein
MRAAAPEEIYTEESARAPRALSIKRAALRRH